MYYTKHPIPEVGRDATEKDNSDFSLSNLLPEALLGSPKRCGEKASCTLSPPFSLSPFHVNRNAF